MKCFFLFLSLLLAMTLAAQEEERIINFDVQVDVQEDRSIQVTEYISVYAAGRKIKRGITRNFPSHRNFNDRSVEMTYNILSIQKNGETEPFFTENTSRGFMVYIGQKSVFLQPGVYEYMIQYEVPNQIGFFDNYDEIYWNAIGTDVVFRVENGSCRIRLPAGADLIQEAAYTGRYGDNQKDFVKTVEGAVLDYRLTKALQPREGFTVALGFEKGFVEEPGIFERYGTLILIILGLVFLFPYYIFTWFRYGQDPPTPAAYPIYESPDGLSAASINYILKEQYQTKGFTASIIDLAIKGYLKIEEAGDSGIIFKTKIYDLIKLKNSDDQLPTEERRLFDLLFSARDQVSIDGTYHSYVESAYKQHQANLKAQHHHFINEGNNTKFLMIPILGSIAIAGLAFFLFENNPYADGVNMKYLFGFIAIAVLGLVLYHYLIKKPTEEKLDVQSRIKGFQLFLEMAEKDRLNLLNPPEMTPELFEAALPFAFALGVEHTWSERFKSILDKAQYQPEWNNSRGVYIPVNFGQSFGNNLTRSATKPPPKNSGGGFGGSGGGCFSGGGGGGGGVGGW